MHGLDQLVTPSHASPTARAEALFSYVLHQIRIPSGLTLMQRFLHAPAPSALLADAYWLVHCRFFQPNSEAQQVSAERGWWGRGAGPDDLPLSDMTAGDASSPTL